MSDYKTAQPADAAPVAGEREAFEAWCKSEGINPDKCARTEVYSYPSARVGWRAWQGRAALHPAAPEKTDGEAEAFESALAELVNKIDSDLDSGDLLNDARRASAALDAILSNGDLVANAHDYFRGSPGRHENTVDFRIGWNACLDAISSARSVLGTPDAAPSTVAHAGAITDEQIHEIASSYMEADAGMYVSFMPSNLDKFARALLAAAPTPVSGVDERPVEPEDIAAVTMALKAEYGMSDEVAGRLAVAAIDTLIARSNHAAAPVSVDEQQAGCDHE